VEAGTIEQAIYEAGKIAGDGDHFNTLELCRPPCLRF
jgi:hypothetical protein